ncbi:MAG: hypothetical protein A3I68_05130 [Candidatus Melainabacteria bacterium RIFCSPLOWO2_02_FULL_35_15]|nr:MAG: hypothetical protein A3F80_07440 [Candidatus Melainabacteria bacterium RIFCSPLOWO2_12_FULL_35_11]OGI12835.1 MAG: hypothetical protein A3I68_05130 [Candidatus Melainabacteria bacterium RIFCSPLOWO2_02_FULL_35_15]
MFVLDITPLHGEPAARAADLRNLRRQDTNADFAQQLRVIQTSAPPARSSANQLISTVINPALANIEKHIMPLLQIALTNINLLNSRQQSTVATTITRALQFPASSAFLGQVGAFGIQVFMNNDLRGQLSAFLRSRNNSNNSGRIA